MVLDGGNLGPAREAERVEAQSPAVQEDERLGLGRRGLRLAGGVPRPDDDARDPVPSDRDCSLADAG